jgi:hypothetical protein
MLLDEFDRIFDTIDVINGSGDNGNKAIIAKTISRLPSDIAERAIDEVVYVDVDGIYGKYHRWQPSIFNKGPIFHFVVLNISNINSEDEKMYVVAHEIAHFVLEHCEWNLEVTNTDRDIEGEADSLCTRWGFNVPDRRKEMKK